MPWLACPVVVWRQEARDARGRLRYITKTKAEAEAEAEKKLRETSEKSFVLLRNIVKFAERDCL